MSLPQTNHFEIGVCKMALFIVVDIYVFWNAGIV